MQRQGYSILSDRLFKRLTQILRQRGLYTASISEQDAPVILHSSIYRYSHQQGAERSSDGELAPAAVTARSGSPCIGSAYCTSMSGLLHPSPHLLKIRIQNLVIVI